MKNKYAPTNNARPTAELQEGSAVFCYLFLRQNEIDLVKERRHTAALVDCKQLILQELSPRLEVYTAENIEVRKEIHHEFVSYIWIMNSTKSDNFDQYIGDLPSHWLETFPGNLLTRVFITFDRSVQESIPQNQLKDIFGANQLIGNMVENDSARIWTDFYAKLNSEILRVHVEDFSLGPRRRGRLCQNILELENYRSMAEIAFPIAEEIVFELEEKELELAFVVKEISQVSDTDAQQKLLHQLLDLSVKSESWRSNTGHRFSATSAYKKIFEDRLISLDETKVLGYQSFSKFFNRNTMPTFRTCEAANERLNVFITRIDRAITLLSTRIRSTMEQQNNALLTSVDKQNKQQITLQETIEAFAIIAITYNGSALIKLLLDSLKTQGLVVNTSFWVSVSVPATLLGSLILMRFLRKRKQAKN